MRRLLAHIVLLKNIVIWSQFLRSKTCVFLPLAGVLFHLTSCFIFIRVLWVICCAQTRCVCTAWTSLSADCTRKKSPDRLLEGGLWAFYLLERWNFQ